MSLRRAIGGVWETSILRHVRYTFLGESEIGMMRKQMKKLDKNHLEMVHLDT